jgi:hypothetical protein
LIEVGRNTLIWLISGPLDYLAVFLTGFLKKQLGGLKAFLDLLVHSEQLRAALSVRQRWTPFGEDSVITGYCFGI